MLILVLAVFTAFSTFFTAQQASAVDAERERVAISTADSAAFELDLALVEGEGFSRTFELRDAIGGEGYTITHDNGTILVSYGGQDVTASTAARDVDGDLEPGQNTVVNEGGEITIEKP